MTYNIKNKQQTNNNKQKNHTSPEIFFWGNMIKVINYFVFPNILLRISQNHLWCASYFVKIIPLFQLCRGFLDQFQVLAWHVEKMDFYKSNMPDSLEQNVFRLQLLPGDNIGFPIDFYVHICLIQFQVYEQTF